jgi:hypothetical protein
MQEEITITKEEYEKLVEDSKVLDALRRCGVDNWEGYDEAMELIEADW